MTDAEQVVMSLREFKVGDRVFAKLKGSIYPEQIGTVVEVREPGCFQFHEVVLDRLTLTFYYADDELRHAD